VLLVDDHPDNLHMYALALAAAGFEVHEARNGQEALERVAGFRPDIIVMDLGMPVMDGWAATTKLKADRSSRSIPLIVLTGHVVSGEGARARTMGADAYLTKPCFPDDLLYEIRRLLRRREGPGGTRVKPFR
jgi:CheY-like chemotaxis protein